MKNKMRKIYNEITLAWNEATQQYDKVVYEDSYMYDGEMALCGNCACLFTSDCSPGNHCDNSTNCVEWQDYTGLCVPIPADNGACCRASGACVNINYYDEVQCGDGDGETWMGWGTVCHGAGAVDCPGAGGGGSWIIGCTDEFTPALNYDQYADGCVENGDPEDYSCCYYGLGCTDPGANNYDENAITDDGSCDYEAQVHENGTKIVNAGTSRDLEDCPNGTDFDRWGVNGPCLDCSDLAALGYPEDAPCLNYSWAISCSPSNMCPTVDPGTGVMTAITSYDGTVADVDFSAGGSVIANTHSIRIAPGWTPYNGPDTSSSQLSITLSVSDSGEDDGSDVKTQTENIILWVFGANHPVQINDLVLPSFGLEGSTIAWEASTNDPDNLLDLTMMHDVILNPGTEPGMLNENHPMGPNYCTDIMNTLLTTGDYTVQTIEGYDVASRLVTSSISYNTMFTRSFPLPTLDHQCLYTHRVRVLPDSGVEDASDTTMASTQLTVVPSDAPAMVAEQSIIHFGIIDGVGISPSAQVIDASNPYLFPSSCVPYTDQLVIDDDTELQLLGLRIDATGSTDVQEVGPDNWVTQNFTTVISLDPDVPGYPDESYSASNITVDQSGLAADICPNSMQQIDLTDGTIDDYDCPPFNIITTGTDTTNDITSLYSEYQARCLPVLHSWGNANGAEDITASVPISVHLGNTTDSCDGISLTETHTEPGLISSIALGNWIPAENRPSGNRRCVGSLEIVPVENQNGTSVITCNVAVEYDVQINGVPMPWMSHESNTVEFDMNFAPATDAPIFTTAFDVTYGGGAPESYLWGGDVVHVDEDAYMTLTVHALSQDTPISIILDYVISNDDNGEAPFQTMYSYNQVVYGTDGEYSHGIVLQTSPDYFSPGDETTGSVPITVTIKAADDTSLFSEATANLYVDAVNDPPVIGISITTPV